MDDDKKKNTFISLIALGVLSKWPFKLTLGYTEIYLMAIDKIFKMNWEKTVPFQFLDPPPKKQLCNGKTVMQALTKCLVEKSLHLFSKFLSIYFLENGSL